MSKPKAKSQEVAETQASDQSNVEAIPCSQEEVEQHLRAFIAGFVLPHAQSRWLEFLIDRRTEWNVTPRSSRNINRLWKAEDVLRMFAADSRYCVKVPNAQRTTAYYESTFGKAPGVYFELGTPPCKMTALEADAKFSLEDESALLSFDAGKRALFFCHDGGVWKCEKE